MSALGSIVFALAFGLSVFVLWQAVLRLRKIAHSLMEEEVQPTGRVAPFPGRPHSEPEIDWRMAA